jgi:hypothetical protein
MSTTLTENPANADFSTGLLVPANGDDFTTSCSLVTGNTLQEIADRTQWLKGWLSTNPVVVVPLTAVANVSSRFTLGSDGDRYSQTSIASAGGLSFLIPPLPIGRKILRVVARWQNGGAASLPTLTARASVTLFKVSTAVGSDFDGAPNVTVNSAFDSAATLAEYKLIHEISATTSEVVDSDHIYFVSFKGETVQTGGTLAMIYLFLGY